MEHFPDLMTPEQTIEMVERYKKHFAEKGFCFYAVDELKSGRFIGLIGLQTVRFEADFTPAVEVGYRLHSDYWGKGYATEGAKRCLDYAFEDLKLDRIVAFTSPGNQSSINVMQKLGMKKTGEFDHPLIPESHDMRRCVLYEIHAG